MQFKIKHILALLLLFCLSVILFYSVSIKHNNQQSVKHPNKELIIESFYHKHDLMKDYLLEIVPHVNNSDSLKQLFFYDKTDLFKKHGIGLFLYKDNELKYWTTNDIPLPVSATPLFFQDGLLNLNNGWYSTELISYGDVYILALLQIRQEYAYKNDLLVTGFNKALHICDFYDIISDSVKNSIRVQYGDEPQESFFLLAPETDLKDLDYNSLLPVLYFISFILFALLIFAVFNYVVVSLFKLNNFLFLLIYLLSFILLRYLMIKHGFPDAISNFLIFSPELYAHSVWLPSLGDIISNIIIFFIFSIGFNRLVKIKIKKISNRTLISILITISIAVVLFIKTSFIKAVFSSLVWNSSISFSFDNILNLTEFSVLGLAVVILLIISFVLIADRIYYILSNILSLRKFLLIIIPVFLLGLKLYGYTNLTDVYTLSLLLSFIALWSIPVYIRTNKTKYDYYKVILLIIIISLISSIQFIKLSDKKESSRLKVLAYSLTAERDLRAEFFLSEISRDIVTDVNLRLQHGESDYETIENVVSNILLSNRYFNKYDDLITVCSEFDSLLLEPEYITVNCFDFFEDIKSQYAINIPNTDFYFLDNHNGRISYFGEFDFYNLDSSVLKVYVELNSKLFSEGLGYPELLLEKRLMLGMSIKEYDYAKYYQGKLVSSTGNFNYPLVFEVERFEQIKKQTYNYQDYSHFIYMPDDDNTIILSTEIQDYSKELVSFSYIFTILFLFFSFVWILFRLRFLLKSTALSLQARIQSSFIVLLILAIITTGTVSVFFIINAYQEKQYEFLEDKVQSVLIELEHEFVTNNYFDVEDIRYLNYLLVRLSNVFYTDINLYDTEGRLFASSRRELYDHGLKGRYMDPYAYRSLIIKNAGTVTIEESIGKTNYLSAYIAFRNINNETIAYLNLPYFAKQDDFREEISGFIVTFSNVFLVLILMSVFVGFFISRQVTRPLAIIKDKIGKMDITKKAEKIKYDRDDELGALIREYNKKVDELTESVNKLAQSEREMAWREMAKQIAHEIKNPLTPIKLSIQYLEHTYKPNDENWQKILKKVSNTIIEQIDVLAEIATEFSNFAKMPDAKKEKTKLKNVIENTISLFDSNDNNTSIEFINNAKSDTELEIDKEQMTRVFNNLIQNAIQAIPENREGKIVVQINEKIDNYIITIQDNGTGIDKSMISKMFQPNFTTKSGGMGLGLSIVKNIINSCGGNIDYETKENEGTKFIIELPKNTT